MGGVCKTSVGNKPVRIRKCSQFYLSPYFNEPNRFRKWRKKDRPRYWWSRSFNDDKFAALIAWLKTKMGRDMYS